MVTAEHPRKIEDCPHEDARKTVHDHSHPTTPVEKGDDGMWHVYGFSEVRQVLRSQLVRQSGFAAEQAAQTGLMARLPILFLEGKEHHQARRETNKFFTPAVTDREYRELMNNFADDLMAEVQRKKRIDLSDISMDMAVKVAGNIVGLTSSVLPGLKARLEGLIESASVPGDDSPAWWTTIKQRVNLFGFFLLDVIPSIRARRKKPQSDVISYLLEQGYTAPEILTECIVYGVAGMVTTREFISVALWHLLERPHLLERMKVGEQEERYAILHEILRLEPVVAHLYRRATDDITIETDDGQVTIPAGERIDLHITTANVDERAVGEPAASLCPAREMNEARPKVPAHGLSFGDGAHRCPGAYVAIQETDIFLRKLLALPGLRIEQPPNVDYFKIAESYELRDFILAVD